MKFEIENVSVIYPDENEGFNRKMIIRDDCEFLQFDFIDEKKNSGGFTLDKSQVHLLRDTLNMIIKNKLII